MSLEILAITGSRADWGLLMPVLESLRDAEDFRLRLAVTGQHLMPGAASLVSISQAGFEIDHQIDLGLDDDDSPAAVSAAAARALSGFGDLLAGALADRQASSEGCSKPDLCLVLGDRYEIFLAATAALFARVPVAHLCGGDVTEGAIDEAMRHSLTKLSHLHFVTNADAARRVAQLGEAPGSIYNVGSPGLDMMRKCELTPCRDLFEEIGLQPRSRNVVVTFHPITLAADSLEQCAALLAALDELQDVGIIITGSNADPEGRQIDVMMQSFAAERDHVVFHASLGSQRYFSALDCVDAVIGNSSSGLYEAPSFKIPTVNIGDRQKGRLRADSVIDCAGEQGAIRGAIEAAFALDCSAVSNPYGDGYTAARIINVLRTITTPAGLIRKQFHDFYSGT